MRKFWPLALLFLGVAAAVAVAAISAGGEPVAAPEPPPGRSAREHFPRGPLAYLEVRDPAGAEARLAALKVWADPQKGRESAAKLAGLGLKQLGAMLGGENADYARKVLAEVKVLHVAVYPPLSFPPEPLVVIESARPAELLRLLSAPGAARAGTHRGAELHRLSFSLNGVSKTTAAAVTGELVLLSPYVSRLHQALDVAACREGALESSPGFADCARRFSSRPLWAYLNAEACAAAGFVEEGDAGEIQPLAAALGLSSLRWAGLGSSLGEGPTPFEFHLEYFPWCPLAALAGPGGGPDPELAGAVPADCLLYGAVSTGDPVKAWTAVRRRIELFWAPVQALDSEEYDERAGAKAVDRLSAGIRKAWGADLEKDLLPALSGDLAFFLVLADGEPVPCVALAARDEAAAGRLMGVLKVRDGTVGRVGGEDGSGVCAARVGRNVILAEDDETLKAVVAAVAAGRTLARSAGFKAQSAALGARSGALLYSATGPIRKLLEGEAVAELLSADYPAVAVAGLTRTGLTLKSTAAPEVLLLLPLLAEADRIARELDASASRRRLEGLADAAQEFARANDGRWPASIEELGPRFAPGSPARRSPASGKDFVLLSLGQVPPTASGCNLLLCHDPDAGGETGQVQAVYVEPAGRGPTARVRQVAGAAVKAHAAQTPAVLALADGARVKLDNEERKRVDSAAADLGADDFARRDTATAALRTMGVKAVPALGALLGSADAEVASRAENLLKELTGLRNVQELRRVAGQAEGEGPARAPRPVR